jgi:hypothetical protein
MDRTTSQVRQGIVATKEATKTAVFEEIAMEQIATKQPQVVTELFYSEKPKLQLCDATIVSAKGALLTATKFYEDLFASDDDINRPGTHSTKITDLNEGKIQKDEFFMLYAIQLQHASDVDGSSVKIGEAKWNLISAAMRNGTIEVTQNGRVIVPEMSMEVFYTPQLVAATAETTHLVWGNGIFELDEPKVLNPNEKVDVKMRFGYTLTAGDANAIRMVMRGIKNFRIG